MRISSQRRRARRHGQTEIDRIAPSAHVIVRWRHTVTPEVTEANVRLGKTQTYE
jgi:hypothetical protein